MDYFKDRVFNCASIMSVDAPTTYVHKLAAAAGQERVLSYAVLGLALESKTVPEQYVIYHHGWPSCRYEALPLHDAALNLKWRVIAVDRYGVGKSTFHPKGTFETWAHDIEQLMNALGIKQAIFVGMSGGGPYACACARYLPNHTAALITMASMVATNDPQHAALLQQMHWPDRLHSYIIDNKVTNFASLLVLWPMLMFGSYALRVVGQLPSMVSRLVCRVLASVGWDDADQELLLNRPEVTWWLLPALMHQSVVQGISGLGWDMKTTSSTWSFNIEDIKAPVVLVCHGEADIALPTSMARHLASHIPGAQLKLYPGQGHLSLLFNKASDILVTAAAALRKSE